jgi:hypothetical protein
VRLLFAGLLAVLLVAVASGVNAADRAKLTGTWQLQTGAKDTGVVWTLEHKDDSIHIIRSEKDQKLADFECNTMGRDCEVKDFGKNGKISMWFSGPKLIEIETRGSQVIKRQFTVAEQGDTMEIKVFQIVPVGKTEVLQFKRVQVSAVH